MSGFSIDRLIATKYNEMTLIKKFYINRIIKLYPSYFVMIVIILLTYYVRGVPSEIFETVSNFSLRRIANIIENFLILPISYLDFFKDLRSFILIQPAWCLGIEIVFYFIYPYIYFYDKENDSNNGKITLLFISLLIFTLGCFGIMETSKFTYFGLLGTLFLFILGTILGKEKLTKIDCFILCFVILYCSFIFIVLRRFNYVQFNLVKNQLVGIVIGIVAIYFLRKVKYTKVDRLLSGIGYNIYLCHAFIIGVLGSPVNMINATAYERIKRGLLIFICSFALGFILFYFIKGLNLIFQKYLQRI